MRQLDCFPSPSGEVSIHEDRQGNRIYLEGSAIQTYARQDGTSLLSYICLMVDILGPAQNVLALGCAGGSLATMLHRMGRRVTVVDDNPASFDIARRYFGMPADLRCVTADFREYLADEEMLFDGVAIDIGGPAASFESLFDAKSCAALRARLSAQGRLAMNLIVPSRKDRLADHIAALLTGDGASTWIYDQEGETDFNTVLARLPGDDPGDFRGDIGNIVIDPLPWTRRRARMLGRLRYARKVRAVDRAERHLIDLAVRALFSSDKG